MSGVTGFDRRYPWGNTIGLETGLRRYDVQDS